MMICCLTVNVVKTHRDTNSVQSLAQIKSQEYNNFFSKVAMRYAPFVTYTYFGSTYMAVTHHHPYN